jgi:hypothetical protein
MIPITNIDGSVPNFFNGIRVVEDKRLPIQKPKIQLSESVQVTSKFRIKTNKWYEEIFGYELIFYMMEGCIITHPENVIKIRKLLVP